MYLPVVHKVFGNEISLGAAPPTGQGWKTMNSRFESRRNWRMSSHSHNPYGHLAIRLAVVAVLWSMATLAAAQDQPAPKWELFGGYSFVYPNADVHGLLPLGVLPVSSPLESNPRGVGASITY